MSCDRQQPEWISGNIFIRANKLQAGEMTGGHAHKFDHTTIVLTGAVHVRVVKPDGTLVADTTFRAPSHFLVKAEWFHHITATEDDTRFWCVYSHRTHQGEVAQVFTGFTEAYH